MHTIKEAVGSLVATDTQATIESLDSAIAQQTRMITSVIEGAHDSKMTISASQPILGALVSSLNDIVQGRANLAMAVREMANIHSNSNLRETSFGCPNGLYPLRATNSAETITATL